MNTLVFWVLFVISPTGDHHTMAFPSQPGGPLDYGRAMCAQMAQSYSASIMGSYVSACHRVVVRRGEWLHYEPSELAR